MVDDIDTRTLLILGLNREPRCGRDISVDEHLILSAGVILPASDGLQIHRRELPAAQRIFTTGLEASNLLLVRHGEPVFAQDNAVFNQQTLKNRRLMQEATVLLRGAEAHDTLNAGTVVPGAVENHDLTSSRQLFDITLEVPLTLLTASRSRQGLNTTGTGVQVLRDALNGRPLASSVTPLHHDDNSGTGFYHPLLHFDELRLELFELGLISLLVELRWALDVVIIHSPQFTRQGATTLFAGFNRGA